MTRSQAKRLKVGDKVVWTKDGVTGVVTRKRYNTVWIRWDDSGNEHTHYADTMDYVSTPEIDAALEEQRKLNEKMKDVIEEQRKKPYRWY